MKKINSIEELDLYLHRIVAESLSSARKNEVLYEEDEEDEDADLLADESGEDDEATTKDEEDKSDATETSKAKATPDESSEDKKDNKSDKDEDDKEEQDKKKAEPPAQPPEVIPAVGTVSPDMLNQKLNMLRSGRSLRDATISGEVQEYYNQLTDQERLDLWTYLNGLSQILAGSVTGDDATDPDSVETPAVVASPSAPVSRGSVEDTMAPIKVKIR